MTTIERVVDPTIIGRLLARHWIIEKDVGGREVVRRGRSTRFVDLEGNRPSFWSILRLPFSAWTKWRSRGRLLMPDPVPWLVHDAISVLRQMVKPGTRVLEVGSGNSTIWFLRKGAIVTSVEGDDRWADAIADRVGSDPKIDGTAQHTLMRCAGDAAIQFIESLPDGEFDIVLIDSVPEHTRRGPALRAARPKLKAGGHMILDNSDAPAHLDGRAAMSDREKKRHSGYGPMRLCVTQTTFWQV